MGLSSALGAALSGLKTSQAGLDLVAANVANAQTPGYVKKTLSVEQVVSGGVTIGVRTDDIRRELDLYLQRTLRSEAAGAAFAQARADYLDRVQTIFGTPDGELSLDTSVSKFSASLDALATSPESGGARAEVLAQAQTLAQTLNAASRDVQDLRGQADQQIAEGVTAANDALKSIEDLTRQIVGAKNRGQPTADLLDLRDVAIDTLASLVDVRVEDVGASGEIRVKTSSGLSLYDGAASTLSFTAAGSVGPEDAYGAGLSGITLTRPSGQSFDLLASGQLRSGSLRALADLRDKTLPQAQTQLDELAANLAQALGTKVEDGAAIAGGVDLTTAGAASGDRLTVSYQSGAGARSVTVVNVGDPSRLPLDDSVTADPDDMVIGVDFSSPTAAADLDAALAARGVAIDVATSADGFAFTSGAAGLTITGGQSRLTAAALSGDGLALPVFVDGSGGGVYSGSLDGRGQRIGFAGRITVNPALLDDPSALSVYATGAAAGDASRATFLSEALKSDRSFSADTGIGGASQPFSGSLVDFAQAAISAQARASATATRVAEGQSLVVSSLQDRLSTESGVNVDEEMSRLIQLQTAYGANARVITAVKEMIDMLMNAV
ncbi:flagellar hook-associated protein FlgK [Hansschlegelia zhihuaiae]|uniref:Flagellar hook-associated protein 1 n=1 Tax=Hansschlegelia zhihuaiae TaxID=405005 RepID=A0A4Q0MGL4_9HYPH|nr:flagellar hook-associated protein FlgK [Hansschlegelia zhihuaiae]RXF72620.1 flagellar hook-associated protein FlgK [Hansschlegelia zhihuaiae]